MSDLCIPSAERVTESERKRREKRERKGARKITIDGDRWSDSEVKEER